MINTKWLELENTSIYLIKFENIGQLPEWHAVGQITLRQIHPNTNPRWYAYSIGTQAGNYFIGHFGTKDEAIKIIEDKDY